MMRILVFILLFLLISSAGCGSKGPVKRSWGRMEGLEKIVGNMNDTSYSSVRSQKPRFNAQEQPVYMSNFTGKFVWAEYAATWCKTCTWQTPQTKNVQKKLKDEIVFITIMTGKSNKYNDHATVETAQQWANRFNLDPAKVIAAELWFKTIPEHRLFSPEGHTLFVHVGALTADQIEEVIKYYQTGWNNWRESGQPADWMTFQ